jgi:nucleoid DNA-binding protein
VTKKNLVRSVGKGLDIDQQQAQAIVRRLLETVLETSAGEGRVELRWSPSSFTSLRRRKRSRMDPSARWPSSQTR